MPKTASSKKKKQECPFNFFLHSRKNFETSNPENRLATAWLIKKLVKNEPKAKIRKSDFSSTGS